LKLLLNNIKQLVQIREDQTIIVCGSDMNELPVLEQAFLVAEDGFITDFGTMKNCPDVLKFDQVIDCSGKLVLPTWCDSHTHLVFAGSREDEFRDRIEGLSYEQIAKRGGGILNSVKRLRNTSEEQLYKQATLRLEELIDLGTGAIEIKSGYGLDSNAEIKMLKVIKKLKANYSVAIKSTFLAAHAIPENFQGRKSDYLDEIINKMLPEVSTLGLADYIDIFCEKNYFSVKDTEDIIKAGAEYNLPAKIHVNQFSILGGVEVACKLNARSVDHLELISREDINALKKSNTMPVALPGCSFFLGIPYTPARTLIEEGLPVAIASDYNPGSAPSGNMNFVVSLACIKLKMTPEEAINAATVNGAYAMGLEKTHGSITRGKKANLMITKNINNYNFLPYAFGTNTIEQVLLDGIPVKK
jgi:imidazolonepropionase